jgi:hypothetical protein
VAQGVPPRRSARLPERGRRGQSDEQGRHGRGERPGRPYPDAFDDQADEDPPPWAGLGIYPTGPGGRERRPRDEAADARAGEAGSAPRPRSGPQDADEDGAPSEGGRGGGRGPDRRRGRRAEAARARKTRREIIIAGVVVVVGVLVVLGVLGKLPFQSKPAPASHSSGLVTTFQRACDAVSSVTVGQYLPGKVAQVSQALGSATQSQCTWTLDAKPKFRVLTVTSQAFAPSLLASGDGSATFSAIDAYGSELQNLQHPQKSTRAPKAQIGLAVGLGPTAFTALQAFHNGGSMTDEVTVVVRDRNVLIIVSMQGEEHGGGFGPVPDATLRAGALAAAHEALAGLH